MAKAAGEYLGGGEDEGAAPAKARKNIFRRRWNFHGFTSGGVYATLILCFVSLVLYFLGNMPELGFSDLTVFRLLQLQRIWFLLLCLFSICAMGFSVHRVFRAPKFANFFKLFFFFVMAIVGAVLALLNSFIMAATGGNG